MPTVSHERKETVSHPLFQRTLPKALCPGPVQREASGQNLPQPPGDTWPDRTVPSRAALESLNCVFASSRWLKELVIQRGRPRPITDQAQLWGVSSGGGLGAVGREVATNSNCGLWKDFAENRTSERILKDKKNVNIVLNSSKWQV